MQHKRLQHSASPAGSTVIITRVASAADGPGLEPGIRAIALFWPSQHHHAPRNWPPSGIDNQTSNTAAHAIFQYFPSPIEPPCVDASTSVGSIPVPLRCRVGRKRRGPTGEPRLDGSELELYPRKLARGAPPNPQSGPSSPSRASAGEPRLRSAGSLGGGALKDFRRTSSASDPRRALHLIVVCRHSYNITSRFPYILNCCDTFDYLSAARV